jgi:hypothetical protein
LPQCRLSTANWPLLSRVLYPEGTPPSLENGAVLDPSKQPWMYIILCGSRRNLPLAKGVSLEMLSPDLTHTSNSFATLDPEVPVLSSLWASHSRLDLEVHASSFLVVSPSPVASTLSSDPRSSHPHQTMRLPESPAQSTSPAVIIGSSMVRNISVPKAKTVLYPGARVQDITRLLPTVLPQMPGADTVVVHVGSKDCVETMTFK